MSATDKSPPHAARQRRDVGKRVGVEERLERGAGGRERCVKRNKREKYGGTDG